jgi:alkylation response protein AidB-like acyl-CoA dehydrogenase
VEAGVRDGVDVDVAVALGRWSLPGAVEVLALEVDRIPGPPLLAAAFVGGGQACLSLGSSYARERVAFGRPLGSMPVQRQAFAAASTALAAALMLAQRAFASTGTDGERVACVPVAADAAWQAADTALQVHGGYGYSAEYEISARWQEVVAVRSRLDRPAYDSVLAAL